MKEQTEDKTCDYERLDRLCGEPVYSNLARCILHAKLPADREEAERLKELKRQKLAEKKKQNDFDFEGAIVFDAVFSDKKTIENAIFWKTKFVGSTSFDGVAFKGTAHFDGAVFQGDAEYQKASFTGATFEAYAHFDFAEFELPVRFQATFNSHAVFLRAKFGKEAWFAGAKFKNGANFYGATFKEEFLPFLPTDVNGIVSFERATFLEPSAQQAACRTAKQVCEALGDRDESDEYFYKEMEAKRKQKKRELKQLSNGTRANRSDIIQRHISYFITCIAETCFGYGVKPARLIRPWLFVFFFFGLLYWLSYGFYYQTIFNQNTLSSGLSESLIFSFGTSIVPGYGLSSLQSWTPPLAVGFETVSASLILAGVIVVLTRKYAR